MRYNIEKLKENSVYGVYGIVVTEQELERINFYVVGKNLSITKEEVIKLNRAHNHAEIRQMKVIDDFTWNVGEYTYRRLDNNDGTLTIFKTDNKTNNKVWVIITE